MKPIDTKKLAYLEKRINEEVNNYKNEANRSAKMTGIGLIKKHIETNNYKVKDDIRLKAKTFAMYV